MQLATEQPHVRAHCRDGSCWSLRADERAGFEAAFTGGKAFWRGRDAWDGVCLVKLADVTGVSVWDDDKIGAMQAEKDEEESRKLLKGEG